jgi:hypothetical protein
MQLDTFTRINWIQSTDGNYLKMSIYPTTDLTKKMSIGVVTLDENETRRLFVALQAILEKREAPEYVRFVDMRGMQKVSAEFRVKREEANRSEPLSAQDIQAQNMKAEGRLETDETKKKKEGLI